MTLLESVEAATGPSRGLDRLIEETLPGVLRHGDDHMVADGYVISGEGHPEERPGQAYVPPLYTASIDAALALRDRLRPEGTWDVGTDEDADGLFYYACLWRSGGCAECQAKTRSNAALALIAALLRAKSGAS